MALVSPGVEVSVIDESNYTTTEAGTVASIVVATAQDKTSGTGTGTAAGTTAANAGKTYLIGSQRELTSTFGNPTFYNTAAGSPINGYELNEYGLMAAYSLLGISNRVYVTRADIDFSELVASTTRPSGAPTNGTVWWDMSTDTAWGIFEWNQSTGAFTNKIPTVITNTSDLDGGVPKTSIGVAGDYAVVATNTSNPTYYKTRSNTWVLVGSQSWQIAIPTITGTVASPRFTNGNTISINSTTVTMVGSTVSELATSINNASITGVTAAVVNNKIEIYADSTAVGVDSQADGKIVIANGSGSILTDAGITAGTYARPLIAQDPHYTVPAWKSTDTTPRPTGSVWIKTTSSNVGFQADVSVYSTSTATFGTASAPAYENDQTALKNLDATGGGANIAAGAFYVQYDVSENDTVTYKLFKRLSTGALEVTGNINTSHASFELGTMVASTFEGDLTGDVTGDVTGTVSDISNHTTTALAEGTNLYYTTARVDSDIAAS